MSAQKFRRGLAACLLILVFLLGCASPGTQRPPVDGRPEAVSAPAGGGNPKIRVDAPSPGAKISSPLQVRGEARGSWYFEGDFQLELEDGGGSTVARGYASAQGPWMSSEFVPYAGTLEFEAPSGEKGRLILRKANPSGLPQHEESVTVPVVFD